MRCVAVCCSVLQCVACVACVAVCCSVLKCVAVCYWGVSKTVFWSCNCVASCDVLQCVAVCYSALQCIAVCCSVLQCVACVAVCCSALKFVAVSYWGVSKMVFWSCNCVASRDLVCSSCANPPLKLSRHSTGRAAARGCTRNCCGP